MIKKQYIIGTILIPILFLMTGCGGFNLWNNTQPTSSLQTGELSIRARTSDFISQNDSSFSTAATSTLSIISRGEIQLYRIGDTRVLNVEDLSVSTNTSTGSTTATGNYTSLLVGSWSAAIKLYDADDVEVWSGASGTTSVAGFTIESDTTTEIELTLSRLSGTVDVSTEVPGETSSNDYVWLILQ